MKWARGFFRLWLVFAFLWIGVFVGAIVWDYVACLADYRETKYCRGVLSLTGLKGWSFILGVPLVLLLAGTAIHWIIRGFRR